MVLMYSWECGHPVGWAQPPRGHTPTVRFFNIDYAKPLSPLSLIELFIESILDISYPGERLDNVFCNVENHQRRPQSVGECSVCGIGGLRSHSSN